MASLEDFQRSDGVQHRQRIVSNVRKHSKRSFVDDDDQLFKTRKLKTIKSLGTKTTKIVKSKKKKKSSEANDEETRQNENEGKIVIETLTPERLIEGTLILGCLMEISVFELKFSITGGLVVCVPITNVSTPYTKLVEIFAEKEDENDDIAKLDSFFQIGDYYTIKIVSKQVSDQYGHVEITGSLNPQDVNHNLSIVSLQSLQSNPIVSAVESIQDYGYQMDIGLEDVKAFLPFDATSTKLVIGQLCHTSIVSIDQRTVRLAYNPNRTLNSKYDENNEPSSIVSFMPGVQLKAIITNVFPYGLELTTLTGEYRAFVTRSNIGEDIVKATKALHQIGDNVVGHVLYVHPHTKQICLSLKPLLKKKMVKNLLASIKIGEIVDKAVVVGHGQFGSVIFKIDGEQHYAIASKNNLCESNEYEVAIKENNKFAIGTIHKARIKNFNLFDNLIDVTLKRSAIERGKEVSRDDLHVGAILEGTVKKIKPNGIYIELGFALNGFLSNLHLIDGVVANLEKTREALFPLKKKVRVRITRLDLSTRIPRIALTAKKSLIKLDQDSLFADFVRLAPGMSSMGVVCLVNDNGVLLEFFDHVRGFVPLKYLATYKIDHPQKVFAIGQVLRANIVTVDVANRRMTCSLIDVSQKLAQNVARTEKQSLDKVDNSKLQVTQVLKNLKIVSKVGRKGFDLTNAKETIRVFLPFYHLADDVSVAKMLFASMGFGTVIAQAMVYTIDAAHVVCVTIKDAFLKPTNALVVEQDDLVLKQSFPAVVKNVAEKGVFFEIPGGRCGVIRNKFLQDGFVQSPSQLGLVKGQSIDVVAFDVAQEIQDDPDNFLKRFRFSMKLSDTWDKSNTAKVELMKNFLEVHNLVKRNMHEKFERFKHEEDKQMDRTLEHMLEYRIGQTVTFVVTQVDDQCFHLKISQAGAQGEPTVTGLALNYTQAGTEPLEVAHMGTAVVCEHDWEAKCLLVFIQPQPAKLIKQIKNASNLALIEKIKLGQTIKGTVFFVGRHYVLASLAGHAPGLVVTVAARRHRNDLSAASLAQMFTLENSYHFKIEHIDKENNAVIVVLDTEARIKNKLEQEEKKAKKTPEEREAKRKERREKKKAWKLKAKLAKEEEEQKGDEDGEMEETDESPKRKLSTLEFEWNQPDLSIVKKKKTQDGETVDWQDNSDLEEHGEKRITREERNQQKRLDEERLRERETQLANLERTPETLEDLEMSTISSPNSSLVWLKYMAYHLDRDEVEKARQVGQRALDKISFREEKEKLNVWVGLMNLENTYGDESTMDALVARAVQYNDPLTIHLQLASIYEQSDNLEKAEQTLRTAMRKFKPSTKTIGCELIEFLMRHARFEQARQLFRQLLSTLAKGEHVEMISKMALAEFRHGDPELGKTWFETMLSTYWKRLDQWSVYLDALVKYTIEGGDHKSEAIDYVRNLYERLATFSFPPSKLRFVYKRYLEFETRWGGSGQASAESEERCQRLRVRAAQALCGDSEGDALE